MYDDKSGADDDVTGVGSVSEDELMVVVVVEG